MDFLESNYGGFSYAKPGDGVNSGEIRFWFSVSLLVGPWADFELSDCGSRDFVRGVFGCWVFH